MIHRHIIEAQQFNKKALQEILSAADHIMERTRRGLPLNLLQGKVLGNLFYVKSMRTALSFDVAMKRLGGSVCSIDSPEDFSSELSGGSFEDTVRVVGSLVDVIVLRHYLAGSARRASEVSPVPVINGGDGPAQHPTQALIDLYCIEKLKGGIDGNAIAFVGDLMNSRTVRSLVYFLAKYSGIRIHFFSPRPLRMKDDIKEYLRKNEVPFTESLDSAEDLRETASKADILYITQIPRGSFGEQPDDYERCREVFQIDGEILKAMKRDTYIMHPLPRSGELSREVDADPRAVYFDQIRYGQYLRMGLICLVLQAPLG
ncbi:MAG TPA: aspartate carbamoyltransferase [Thermodesulfobacteriota bacterium]|nr:aspartate carbamoyltransferase [Thermodesulfobacteriota bacterium]